MLSYAYFLIIALAATVGFVRDSELDRPLKIFRAYLLLTLAVEITGHIVAHIYNKNNAPIYNAYIPLHILMLSLTFNKAIYLTPLKLTIILLLSMCVIATGYLFLKNGVSQFNSEAYLINLTAIIIFSFAYMSQQLYKPINLALYKNGLLVICCGLLFQSIVTIFYIGPFKESFIKYEGFAMQMKQILKWSNIVTYFIFLIAFTLCRKYQST